MAVTESLALPTSTRGSLPASPAADYLLQLQDGNRGRVAWSGSQWADLAAGVYNLQDFGAIPDGDGNGHGTDNSAAFQSALDAIAADAAPGVLTGQPGTYLVNSPLTYQSANAIACNFQDGTVIDGSNCTAPTFMQLGGQIVGGKAVGGSIVSGQLTGATMNGAAPLAASATSGSRTIATTLPGVSPGSILLVSCGPFCSAVATANSNLTFQDMLDYGPPSPWFSADATYHQRGEMVQVLSVTPGVNGAPNTFTLRDTLVDNYHAAQTVVYLLQMPRVVVRNLTLIGNQATTGLLIAFANEVRLESCHAQGFRYALFALEYCFGAVASNNSGWDFFDASLQTCYGLSTASSQNVLISGCRFRGGRSAIAAGGWEPTRYLTVIGNFVDGDPEAVVCSLDMHANVEFAVYAHNVCLNGIVVCGKNFIILNNVINISGPNNNAGISYPLETSSDWAIFRGNTITANGSTATASTGFLIVPSATATSLEIGMLVVADNTIVSPVAIGLQLSCGASSSTLSLGEVQISNNNFNTTSTCLNIVGSKALPDAVFAIGRITVSGGSYCSSGYNALLASNVTEMSRPATIRNALFIAAATCYPLYLNVTSDVFIDNCCLEGPDGAPAYDCVVASPGNIYLLRNALANLSDNGGWQFPNGSGKVRLLDNSYQNVVGVPSNNGIWVCRRDSDGHEYRASSVAPSIAAAPGAGTDSLASIEGSDHAGVLSLTTGQDPLASAAVCIISFGTPYPTTPQSVLVTPANAAAASLSGTGLLFENAVERSASSFTLVAASAALPPNITLLFNYTVA